MSSAGSAGPRALPRLERALDLALEARLRYEEAEAQALIARAYLGLGERADASVVAVAAIRIAAESGYIVLKARARAVLREAEHFVNPD